MDHQLFIVKTGFLFFSDESLWIINYSIIKIGFLKSAFHQEKKSDFNDE